MQRTGVWERLMWAGAAAGTGLAAAALLVKSPTTLWIGITLLIIGVLCMAPKNDRVVAVLGSLSLAMAVLFPAQFIPTILRYAELIILLLFGIAVIIRRGISVERPTVPLLLLAYLIVTGWSTYQSEVEGAVFQFWMHAIIGGVLLFLGSKSHPSERRTILKTLVVIAVAEAVYAVFEMATRPPLLWANAVPGATRDMGMRLPNEIISGLDRAQGTFGHPLPLAFMLVVALGVVVRYPLFVQRSSRITVTIILLAGVFATGSRSAMLVALLILCFTAGMTARINQARNNLPVTLLRGTFLLALTVAIAGALGLFSSAAFDRFAEGGSVSHRTGALDAVPQLFENQDTQHVFFGNGWYSIRYVFEQGLLQTDGFYAVDNQIVALLVTGGVISVLLFGCIAYITLLRRGSVLRPAAFAVFAMFWVFDIYEWPAGWAILTVVIGMVAALRVEAPEDEPEAVTEEVGSAVPALRG